MVANFPTSQPGFFLQKPEYGNQRALPSCRLDRPTRPSFISIRVVRNAKPTPVEFTVPRDDTASLLRDRRKKRRTRFNENVVRRAEVGYTLHQCAQKRFLRPTYLVHNPNGISIGSAVFAQLTSGCRRASERALPLKIELPIGGSGPI